MNCIDSAHMYKALCTQNIRLLYVRLLWIRCVNPCASCAFLGTNRHGKGLGYLLQHQLNICQKSGDTYDDNPDAHSICGSCPIGFSMVNVASMHVIAHQSDASAMYLPGLQDSMIRTARTYPMSVSELPAPTPKAK